jgi:CubicO group peptidase (beta-lactamase class C family)
MKAPFSETFHAPLSRLIGLAAFRRSWHKLPALMITDSQPLEKRIEVLAGWLDALHARDAFNGTVLIAQRGTIRFEKHCGFADVDGVVPLSGRSSFSLASVSKPFTAMGIMLLARKRKLTLDDRMAQYIPELAGYGEITIKHLLHHTSGVPDYMVLAGVHWDPEHVLTNGDLIHLLAKYRPPPYYAPGERFEYSNTGYALLGEIMSRVSGIPYAKFMAEEIFEPLGMNNSAAFNLASKRCSLQYRVFGMRKRFGRFGKKVRCDLNYLDGVFGDGGIYASAEDITRWDSALRDGTLLPNDVYAEAFASGRLNNGEQTGYGFGWEIESPSVVRHWGEWQGFTSYVRRNLKNHALLVVLSNLGPAAQVEAMSAELGSILV